MSTTTEGIDEVLYTSTRCDRSSLERRLLVLEVLTDVSTPIEEERLATIVAARETETPPKDVSEDVVEQVHITLYHNHLPKLADAALVEYDGEEGVIHEITADFESRPEKR